MRNKNFSVKSYTAKKQENNVEGLFFSFEPNNKTQHEFGGIIIQYYL